MSKTQDDAFARRLVGRMAAAPISDPTVKKGGPIAERNEEIDEEKAARIASLRTKDGAPALAEVLVRSPLTCQARYGVCRYCYGRNLATGHLVGAGEAVGLSAPQPIGEPGTQLTMRPFHPGGVAGGDVEARVPKGKAEM